MDVSHSRAVVVFNPVKVDGEALKCAATERAGRHGWTDLRFVETTEEDPGEGMARAAALEGAGLVVAVGGDGTVRSVATGLHGTQVPLGIVPRGTGNLLARNLSVPLDNLDRALGVAMGGRTRLIDLGTVHYTDGDGVEHDEVFLVMLGAGMDADMIAGTDADLKAKVGWAAYVGSFAQTLLSGHRIRVEFSVDDAAPVYAHTRTLLVANCGTLQGGMVLLPDAEIDDGMLDVLTLRVKGVVGWVQASYIVFVEHTFLHHLKNLRRRTRARRQEGLVPVPLTFRQGAEMSATVLEEPAAFQIDGEDIGTVSSFSAGVRHRGLSVRVPLS